MINVIIAVGGLIEVKTRVAPPIRCMSKCPAVILAVSRTARAMGWINRLIVSIIMSIGIRGIGVPCGRKWANVLFILWRNPRKTVPAHSGIAIPRFIDSWVVGVKVWGNKPKRFVEPIKIIRETSIRHQVCPFGEWIDIICLVIILTTHCWNVWKRLLKRRLEDVSIMDGSIIIIITTGRPIIVGVMKEAKRFSFILVLKGYLV